jgi:nucleotide-binding universal stress UspA family protein
MGGMAGVLQAESLAPTLVPSETLVVFTGDRDGRIVALVSELAERGGVEIVRASERDEALGLVAEVRDPIVCMAADRRGRVPLPGVAVPKLLVGPRCADAAGALGSKGRTLVCLDGSARAEAALHAAVRCADALGLDLSLVHVAAATPARGDMMQRDRLASGYLTRTAGRTRPRAGVDWEVLHGEPVKALLAHAHLADAALLALNSHGASTSTARRSGRVPARLVVESTVPVLVTSEVRVPDRPPARRAPSPQAGRRPSRPVASARPTARAPAPCIRPGATHSRHAPARPPPPPGDDRAERGARRRGAVAAAAVALTLLVAGATTVPISYHSVNGSTMPADELVDVGGGATVDEDRTVFLVPLVRSRPVTLVGGIVGWLDPKVDVRPDERSWDRQRGERVMIEAARLASVVAAAHLGLEPRTVALDVDTHGLGGPSAGLAFALEIVERMTPGALAGHRVIAVTGALGDTGDVGVVGGVRYKAVAALRAGADVLLVPWANYEQAVAAAPTLHVIGVATFDDALRALRDLAA